MSLLSRIPPHSVTIAPYGGLCNQLFVISSALAVGKRLRKEVYVLGNRPQLGWTSLRSLFEIRDQNLHVMSTYYKIDFSFIKTGWQQKDGYLLHKENVVRIFPDYLPEPNRPKLRFFTKFSSARNTYSAARKFFGHKMDFDAVLNIDLPQFFPQPGSKTMSSHDRILRVRLARNPLNGISSECFAVLSSHNRLLITSCGLFYPSAWQNLSYLRPVERLRQKIQAIETRLDKANLVGIHIRGQDKIVEMVKRGRDALEPVLVAKARQNLLDLFIQHMKQEVKANRSVQFFVASDEPEAKRRVHEVFGERVVMHQATLTRRTRQGMDDAVIDLYALGMAKKIIGSAGSTYSRQATYLEGAELHLL